MSFPASRITPGVQSVFRVVIGFLFTCHGAASLFGVLGGAVGTHGGTVSFPTWPGWWAAAIQLACGILVMIGAGTRAAALLASGSMAFAYFTVHFPHSPFPMENEGEPSALYAWAFLLIAAIGPGPWTVVELVRKIVRTAPAAQPVGAE
ncbi:MULTISPECIES: DoxX family protein [Amycolatopsis]|uniref:DoxX family protein n=1 Tax=Amycolatopsis dendrobii TaxID=2760662 RepID=A0A7W3ZFE0_9PSEU|nr:MULTISPECIES: DoxX family protein [Amycolatopsis]MBB1159375.1 DoxX family protein [Amycolatopsis dendrobii]UKD55969.1 DoxX family protein [Amycolatopsis sp. FU40]